ncbi:MAG: c-type cytochrome [Fuerstiella sp.]|nr:c-type cytochrome [Fuerstiella sp.]
MAARLGQTSEIQIQAHSNSVCHKVGELGSEVGPNLLTTRNRGKEFILLNVLDPNREVLPAWHDYAAVLKDGRTTNGIITQESPVSLTLRRAEAKESKIRRTDIDLLRDTGHSLMPSDLEKTISVQQMADILAWLLAQ